MAHQYNKWTILKRLPNKKCLAKCACGATHVRQYRQIVSGLSKQCKSCRLANMVTAKGLSKSKIYYIWYSMMQRCYRPSVPAYKNYGGRGIKVSKGWHKFNQFYDDMGDAQNGKWLDRIDNNKGYSKKNCRWASANQQISNRRNVIFYKYNNKKMCLSDISKATGIKYHTLYARIKKYKMPIKIAISSGKDLRSHHLAEQKIRR